MRLEKKLKKVEKEIEQFKDEIYESTKWETGHNILDFIDTNEAWRYGKLLGRRDTLLELKD